MLGARALAGVILANGSRGISSTLEAASSSGGSGSGSGASTSEASAGLSAAQQAELASMVLSSFKHDATTAASILNKSLDDQSRRELLAALGARHLDDPPELSRCARLRFKRCPTAVACAPLVEGGGCRTAQADWAKAGTNRLICQVLAPGPFATAHGRTSTPSIAHAAPAQWPRA